MEQTKEQIDRLAKIRALLAKAEGTNHAAEAKLFTEKAQELMAKWAIDDMMLQASQHKDAVVIEHSVWLDANEFRAPKIQLIMAIAGANGCKLVMFPQYYRLVDGVRKRQFRVAMVGVDTDCSTVETLFTSLLTQASMAYLAPDVQLAKSLECSSGGHSIRWRNAFMMGYAREIRVILERAASAAKVQGAASYAPGTMAMVFVGKQVLVAAKYAALYPKLGKAKSTSAGQFAGSAAGHGQTAARRSDTGAPKLGGNGQRQLN